MAGGALSPDACVRAGQACVHRTSLKVQLCAGSFLGVVAVHIQVFHCWCRLGIAVMQW